MDTQHIAIRVDGDSSVELCQVLDKDGGAYLVVKELEGSNPHFHAVLHSVRKLSAVRQALKRAMPQLNGNGSYSVTAVRDLTKYQRYMMKGETREKLPHVVAAHGVLYTDSAWQSEMHDAYWDENDSIQRKRKFEHIDDVVLDRCKELSYSWQNRQGIAEQYIRELVSRNKPINIFSLKSHVNLLQIKLCPDDRAIEDLAQQV